MQYLTIMSINTKSQIFQSGNSNRWVRFKWVGRFLLLFLALAVVVVVVALKNTYSPSIPLESRAIKKVLSDSIPAYRESAMGRQYRGFRSQIQDIWKKGKGCGQKDSVLNLSSTPIFSDSLGIRAGFYVTWYNQSFTSLKKNISKLNLVIPEWFFIDPTADTLYSKMDDRAYNLIKASGVKVMPMLSNYYKDKFNGASLHRILNSPAKQTRLIDDIVRLLKQNSFSGINVDFEELEETKNENLSKFQKDLYTRLHSEGLLVTQNVMPFNEDYNYTELSKYNDYIFLMAYDEHSETTKAGPICSQKWIEAAVGNLCKKVTPSKVVLNIAAYGFDWSKDTCEKVTYQEALATARESDGIVDFDNDTYNLHYKYYDGKDQIHEVHFVDAATNFNTLRYVTEYGLAGTALWHLGAEDNRLWDFYDKPMTKGFLKSFDFKEFSNVSSTTAPDFIGEGEILEMIATPTPGHITPQVDYEDMLITEETYDKLPSTYIVKKWGKNTNRKLVLTFDDGPDPIYTKEILDTLAYYHVPAAFFVVGIQAERNIPLIKRIMREGHEIGNHTFTHPNIAEVSPNRALLEMDATRLLIECITGKSTVMFRAPFNADSDPEKSEEMVPIALSRQRNYITVGESIDPEDWQKDEIPNFNQDTIFNRVLTIFNKHLADNDTANIILLHDAGGTDRKSTVLATGMIIRYFQSKGYTFTTVADLLGKKPEDLMPPVPKGSGYTLLQFNYFIAEAGYMGGTLLNSLFLVFIAMGLLRLIAITTLAIKQKNKEKKLIFPTIDRALLPKVSIIVPAYNEEVNAVNSMHNLLRCDYPSFEVIFVDDGSKDNTYANVLEAFKDHPKVQVFTKPNGGKSSALNFGIEQTSSEFVVCIDADTKLLPDAISKMMRHFYNPLVGAVAGVVKAGNEVNIITKWQSLEYTISQNFDRKAFAYLNAITVVPGAIGAFRKDALEKAGGFTTDTLAEDCDLSIRILREGYIIANEPHAVAMTEVPESVRQFMKQRFRWSFGVMQTFWKHKDALFNNQYKSLGWVALPDLLLFKYFIPLFTPLADVLMIIGLLSDNAAKIGIYYLIFTAVDVLIASVTFALEKEKPGKLVWIIPQRIIYRWLMIVVLFRAIKRALKGELQHWGVLKRTGNVKEIETK